MKPEMILVTGGSGFIGSHTTLKLIEAGYSTLILDNLSNSSIQVLDRIHELSGHRPGFIEGDIRDQATLDEIFKSHSIGAVLHFAGLKAVGESIEDPIRYYENNVGGSLKLLKAMQQAHVRRLVFSSSATVYGDPTSVPIPETAPLCATNPYGRSKIMVEEAIRDLFQADPHFQAAILRYFNPGGAHPSGRLGENPRGVPNNLIPLVSQVASGVRACLHVFGSDYPTQDGTGVRDYIHIEDLAEGHLKALESLSPQKPSLTLNLGTGKGYSVLEIIRAFESSSGKNIPFKVVARRQGDIATCFADPSEALRQIHWKANRDLSAICMDAWRWQSSNALLL